MTMVWNRRTGQATYILQIKDGQANLQLSFLLCRHDYPHIPPPVPRIRHEGKRQKEHDSARAAPHQHRRLTQNAVLPFMFYLRNIILTFCMI